MIRLRSPLVAMVGVLLALATGIGLGAGPLQEASTAEGGDGRSEVVDDESPAAAEATARAAYADAAVRELAPSLLAGTLRGRGVILLRLPGADPLVAAQLSGAVRAARGRVTGDLQLGAALLDPSQRQLVEELATQLVDEVRSEARSSGRWGRLPGAAAGGYRRTGALLAAAVTTPTARVVPGDPTGDRVLAALETAGLVSGEFDRRGSVVLAVAGAPSGSADEREGAGLIVADLLGALDRGAAGVVLVGPAAAAAPDGVLGALRAGPVARAVSTVDTADSAVGAVAAVLALAGAAAGATGHYGGEGAPDGAVPPLRAAAGRG